MQAITHKITHHYQSTTTSCGYASLAILLSHYGKDVSTEELLEQVPQAKNEEGKPLGSLTAQLAQWCVRHGFAVDFVSFDFLITDVSWQGLSNSQLLQKLESVKDVRDVRNVGGKHWSREYVQAYIDLIESGGKLSVLPHVTTKLLYEKLKHGPVYANICSSVVYGTGRQRYPEANKRMSIDDDMHGIVGTHSVVIYGNDENGNFLVADPWQGMATVQPETMLCGITAAALECDSQCFQISQEV